jgi:hypothetical protein
MHPILYCDMGHKHWCLALLSSILVFSLDQRPHNQASYPLLSSAAAAPLTAIGHKHATCKRASDQAKLNIRWFSQ